MRAHAPANTTQIESNERRQTQNAHSMRARYREPDKRERERQTEIERKEIEFSITRSARVQRKYNKIRKKINYKTTTSAECRMVVGRDVGR